MNDLTTRASFDQSRASDPSVSAWVSANAGSGKTHVLVNRVIRLMLTGTDPEKILCLTYTKAAAAEMSNRLYKRLAEWIPLDDDALIEKIHENTGHIKFKKSELAKPRRLFARALETPGGLKIQTIHAFCEQLLHRFPLEAGVTSSFKVMDDRQAKDLLWKIRADFFSSLDNKNDAEAQLFLDEVIKFSGGQSGFDELLELLLNKRDDLQIVYQDLQGAHERLAQALGIKPTDNFESILKQVGQGFKKNAFADVQKILEGRTGAIDQKQAVLLKSALQTSSDHLLFELLKDLTLTKKNVQKASRSLCTVSCRKEHPEVFTLLEEEAMRISQIVEKTKAISVLHATNGALHIGKAITGQYEKEKNALGFYDYHDLIAKVLAMFDSMPNSAWVLYKLDGGLDHILIDEAQDTSPAQWDIIQFLADDFFSGQAVRPDIDRTVFAVGDRKQSIYSFQGAAPASFDQRRLYFEQTVKQAGMKFSCVEFDVSFRSTKQVLSLVDDVFAQEEAAKGIDKTVHSAQRSQSPGLVELWPVEEKNTATESKVWEPEIEGAANNTRVQVANKIAQKIRYWLDTGETLASEKRPIRPGDILILVRRRTQLMDALVRALKLADVPVAGVDRLRLTRHISVQDLIALAKFVLLPQDDLNLSGLIKSSLLEKDNGQPFDDDDLILIASTRSEQSVWQAFLKKTDDGHGFLNAKNSLLSWRQKSRQQLPFEFFSTVLNVDQKRKSILRRLGSEAGEPIDAFLLLAQDYERGNTPTLQGFLSWLENGDTEIKREMENNENEVRIMTIHGAKGLESKIVILPDTYDVPDNSKAPKFLNADEITPVWKLKSGFETTLINKLKEQYLSDTFEEYNRLLYVAMTRAEDRLYIGAAQSNRKLSSKSWYQLISNILCKEELKQNDDIFGQTWRLSDDPDSVKKSTHQSEKELTPPSCLPDWAKQRPAKNTKLTDWIAPSKLGLDIVDEGEQHISPLTEPGKNRFLRGNLIHKMLQYLPDLPTDKRMTVAKEYVLRHGTGLSDKQSTETLAEINVILNDQRFAQVFGPGSIAEAPIVARITLENGQELILNGQIDRLCIADNEIFIIDYKTNKPPPTRLAGVNHQYIRQLAAYRLALLQIYPNHEIRAGLLWTYNAVLMEIDEGSLQDVFSS